MTAAALAADASDIITKGEFARRREVSPGRVSQWISEGKISDAALVGVGREQRIRESIAVAQLRARTDTGQRFGNGAKTSLDLRPPAPGAAPAAATPGAPGGEVIPIRDDVASKIQLARLEQLERQNRRDAEEEAHKRGLYVYSGDVSRAMTKMLRDVLGAMDGALPDFATAIAARFELPQRELLHLLRAEFRTMRGRIAATNAALAGELDQAVEHDPLGALEPQKAEP